MAFGIEHLLDIEFRPSLVPDNWPISCANYQ